MQFDFKEIWEGLLALFVKWISIPALIALFIKIAVQVKKKQATIVGVIVSLISGLGTAYLAKGFIFEHFESEGNRTLLIALIAIMADRIAEYLLYKADVEKFMDVIGNSIVSWVKNKFKK